MSEFFVATRMQRHDLHKLHGLGNDFLVWFRPTLPGNAADVAVQWCDRRTGIGADGLIVAIDDKTSPRFHLFNSDGSVPEISGNGLRCMAHAIAARRGVAEAEFVIETPAGPRLAIVTNGLDHQATVRVGMGAPSPGPSLAALDIDSIVAYRRVQTIDMGNPHTVIQVDSLDGLDIASIGPAVEALFPETGMNVHLATISGDRIALKIWERGAGVTEACGSGACAAAAVAALAEPDIESFVVDMPGGSASVTVGDEILLEGPSAYVAAIAGLDGPVATPQSATEEGVNG